MFSKKYLSDVAEIAAAFDTDAVEEVSRVIADVRQRGGRAFFLGVGGGAAHASHAAADFRKLLRLEAYAVTDNVPGLTAHINDDGWHVVFVNLLRESTLSDRDLVFVFSVGGGNLESGVSTPIVRALEHARSVGARIVGVVGRDGGYTARVADACVVVPTVDADLITAYTESFQAIVWHLLVSHPSLSPERGKWESIEVQGRAAESSRNER